MQWTVQLRESLAMASKDRKDFHCHRKPRVGHKVNYDMFMFVREVEHWCRNTRQEIITEER